MITVTAAALIPQASTVVPGIDRFLRVSPACWRDWEDLTQERERSTSIEQASFFLQGPPSSLDFSTPPSFFTISLSAPCSADSNPNPCTFLSSPPRANHPSSGWIRSVAFGLEIETPCYPKSQSEVDSTYSSFSMSPTTKCSCHKHAQADDARAPVSKLPNTGKSRDEETGS